MPWLWSDLIGRKSVKCHGGNGAILIWNLKLETWNLKLVHFIHSNIHSNVHYLDPIHTHWASTKPTIKLIMILSLTNHHHHHHHHWFIGIPVLKWDPPNWIVKNVGQKPMMTILIQRKIRDILKTSYCLMKNPQIIIWNVIQVGHWKNFGCAQRMRMRIIMKRVSF